MPLPKMNTARLLISAVAMMLAHTAWPVTVNRGLGPEPDSLDIHQAQGLSAINILRDLREGLLSFDATGELVPCQAISWQVLDGGKPPHFQMGLKKMPKGATIFSSFFVHPEHGYYVSLYHRRPPKS